MKRKYVKPGMQVVKLQTRNHLLVGSTVGNDVTVFGSTYNEKKMVDL